MRAQTVPYTTILLMAFYAAGCEQSRSPSADGETSTATRDNLTALAQDNATPIIFQEDGLTLPTTLTDISDIAELQELFNRDQDKPRLILLLSPT